MKIGKTYAICMYGYEAIAVTVEVDIMPGPMAMQIVGLSGSAMKESRDRIRAAITRSGFQYPVHYIVVNLAPGERPKEGTLAELAIAVAILIASGQVDSSFFEGKVLLGSLSLDGQVKSSAGLMGAAIAARQWRSGGSIIVPAGNIEELSCIPGIDMYPLPSLAALHDLQYGLISPRKSQTYRSASAPVEIDMETICGQEKVKSGLAYSAVGRHHMMMIGAPGTGKTLLARAAEGLQPALSLEESLETTRLHSLQRLARGRLITRRPFRSPHHTTSEIAMVGGGIHPVPGEISLAHNGILFLDELLEFPSATLQALREPLEEGKITICRSRGSLTFPARFTLLAATNPCRCGYIFSVKMRCQCRYVQVQNLHRKIIGPFLDRISIEAETIEQGNLLLNGSNREKPTSWWGSKITEARARMEHRNVSRLNSRIEMEALTKIMDTCVGWQKAVAHHCDTLQLSHRGMVNTLRLAVSIMDFRETNSITDEILDEAFSFRVVYRLQKTLLELVA